jgi:hypothetical protein
MQLTLEGLCPYHGRMWQASDTSPASPDQPGALTPRKKVDSKGHFRISLKTNAYLHVAADVSFPIGVVIDGRFTSARSAHGTATITGPCQWSPVFRHWRIP